MIFIQIIAIQFAIAMAKHDGPSVTNFEYRGITAHDMSVFHRYGWWSKLFFVVVCAWAGGYPNEWKMIEAGLLSGLWIYLLFDPALNVNRYPRREWHYLGLNDADGRFWNGLFGKNSGKFKAAILLTLITLLNILCL